MEVPAWLQVATDKDLYRHNAFRISGLAVTATPREVRRRVSEARAAEALGAEHTAGVTAPGSRWLPLKPPADHAAVREALRRLEDPVRRVVDEFFWFWPLEESDGAGLMKARQAWEGLAKQRTRAGAERSPDDDARSIAVHNLAVVYHADAVEAKGSIGASGRRMLWQRAYRHWRMVLDDAGCWRWLDERIRALGDPRLRTVSGDAFRDALPTVLLELHAGITVDAARRQGGEKAARGHVSLMREFMADEGVLDAVLRRATAPTVAAIRHRNEAAAGPDDEPAALERSAASLLAETKPDLQVLRAVLGAEHPVVSGAADAVASAVNGCAVACANSLARNGSATRDPSVIRATAHLRTARWLAGSTHVRTMVEENLVVLLSNDVLLACAEAARRTEPSPWQGDEEAFRLLVGTEAGLRELRELRPDDPETDRIHDGVAMTACRLLTRYFNDTQDIEGALDGYRRALPVAVSGESRAAIQKNIDTLTREQATAVITALSDQPAAAARPAAPRIRLGSADRCYRCNRRVLPSVAPVLIPAGEMLFEVTSCIPCRHLFTEVGSSASLLDSHRADVRPAGRRSRVAGRALLVSAVAALLVACLVAGLGTGLGQALGAGAVLLLGCLLWPVLVTARRRRW
ncbi:hypothetical protein [Nonomuraea sp. NPDC049504]|uniref:hypothetical protein n=1 Tax=Nonomuraea sp. NPDC049504 TaxID=3154729 RepID=UPI0034462E65